MLDKDTNIPGWIKKAARTKQDYANKLTKMINTLDSINEGIQQYLSEEARNHLRAAWNNLDIVESELLYYTDDNKDKK